MGPCVSYASKYSGNRPRVRWRGLHCTCRKTYDCRSIPKRKASVRSSCRSWPL